MRNGKEVETAIRRLLIGSNTVLAYTYLTLMTLEERLPGCLLPDF